MTYQGQTCSTQEKGNYFPADNREYLIVGKKGREAIDSAPRQICLIHQINFLTLPPRPGVWNSFVAAVITGNSSFRCTLDNAITQMQLVLHTCQPSTPLSIRT